MSADNVENDILSVLAQDTDKSTYISALQHLADCSREDDQVRSSLSRADVLRALISRLEQLPEGLYDIELERQSLRCIGNGCAMQPDGVKAVCDHGLGWTSRYTQTSVDSSLQDNFAKVLYNMTGADFTSAEQPDAENPALTACYQASIHVWLLQQLAMPQSPEDLEMFTDILFLISGCAKETDASLPDKAITATLTGLPTTTATMLPDSLATLLESVTSLCRVTATKMLMVTHPAVDGLFKLLETNVRTMSRVNATSGVDEISLLTAQASSLIWLLSDISADPVFGQDKDNALVVSCKSVLLDARRYHEQLVAASCLVVGNAWLHTLKEDSGSSALTYIAREVLPCMLRADATSDLLYAAAGLLTVMCRPTKWRQSLGREEQLTVAVEKLCGVETPQVREAGVRLLKALGRNCPENQARLAGLAHFLTPTTATQQTGST